MIAAGLMIVLSAGLLYWMPANAVHIRLNDLIQEYGQWQPDRAAPIRSATACGWNFITIALKSFMKSDLWRGTGGFRDAYRKKIESSQMVATDNPTTNTS